MKKMIAVTGMILCMNGLHAQTLEEWFAQKKTQIKYLHEQIAALKVYAGYLKEGYNIVSKGINTINDIKNGDFDLHNDFINSLGSVNPSVKNMAQVQEIINYQNMIVEQFKQCIESCKSSDQFASAELDYINHVYSNMAMECLKDVNALLMVSTNNTIEMTDDERLQRINAIYLDMQDKYSFASSFTKKASVLAANRVKEQNDINLLTALYNTNKQK